MKIVKNESQKNTDIDLGDIIEVESAFGTAHYLVISNQVGNFGLVDLGERELIGKSVGELEDILEEFFHDEDITILKVDRIVTTEK